MHSCQLPIDAKVSEVMKLDSRPGSSREWIESEISTREVQAFIDGNRKVTEVDDNDEAGKWLREHQNQAGEGLAS